MRADETDPLPREQEERVEAASGVRLPPPIPSKSQLPDAEGAKAGGICKPDSATDAKATPSSPSNSTSSSERVKQGRSVHASSLDMM